MQRDRPGWLTSLLLSRSALSLPWYIWRMGSSNEKNASSWKSLSYPALPRLGTEDKTTLTM